MSRLTHRKLGYLKNEFPSKFRMFHHSKISYHHVEHAIAIETKDDAILQAFALNN